MLRYISITFLFLSSVLISSCSQTVNTVREELGFNSAFDGMGLKEYNYSIDFDSEIEVDSKISEINTIIDEVKSAKLIGNPFVNPKSDYLNLSIEVNYLKFQPLNVSISGKSFSQELAKNLNEIVKNNILREQMWDGFLTAIDTAWKTEIFLQNDCVSNLTTDYFGQQPVSSEQLNTVAREICTSLKKIDSDLKNYQKYINNYQVLLPASDITTYILDLSGSTYPIQQIEALGSGIERYISYESLGDPFSIPKKPALSLSFAFITANSANSPRILLSSGVTGESLNEWLISNVNDLDAAKFAWSSFLNIRKSIWENQVLEISQCKTYSNSLIDQSFYEYLDFSKPIQIICDDAIQTSRAKLTLDSFVEKPNVALGSDVFGALTIAVKNTELTSSKIETGTKSIIFASDMIDETSSSNFKSRITNLDPCEEASKDYSIQKFDLSDFEIIAVGLANSKNELVIIEKIRQYWNCFFNEAGTVLYETSDLSGY